MERLLIDMIRFTDPDRFRSRILCIGGRGELADVAESYGIPVEALNQPEGRNVRLPVMLARYLSHSKTVVLHTHGPYAHLYGALATLLAPRCKVVHTIHGHLWPRTRRREFQNRLATWLSHSVVAVSRDLLQKTTSAARPSSKLHVIHNGVNPQQFRVSERPKDPNPTVAMVARIAQVKDFHTLFHAVVEVKKKIRGFELRLVGDGPLRQPLQRLTRELEIESAVRFLGHCEDVAGELARAAVFVLSSHTEGLSISLLEAMSCGLPAVATDVGGNKEVVEDGVTGFLVPPRSPSEMAGRIQWLLENPTEARAMGTAGRRRVEACFDVRRTVSQYERIYLQLAGRDAPCRPSQRSCGTCSHPEYAGDHRLRP